MLSYNVWVLFLLCYCLLIITGNLNLNYISVHHLLILIFLSLVPLIYYLMFYTFNYIFSLDGSLYFGDFLLFKFCESQWGSLAFFIDKVSFSFMFLTLWIALFANIFTSVYIRSEMLVERFLCFLNLFVLSMVLLIVGANWITLLLGWEMIGASSYLLINFWVSKSSTFKAAFKAFTFNKLSDIFLFIALLIYYNVSSSLSFQNLSLVKIIMCNNGLPGEFNLLSVFCFCLVISAFCKSAQFGFHIWLPDSMEAPIPASALIHSATLVSAGIFLLLKFWVFLKYCSFMYSVVLLWSVFTAFYGALVAGVQTDLKRTLAYSTISHCGYIIFSLFLENHGITVLYLYSHGIFKAFSFMALGNIIYSFLGSQDVTRVTNIFYFNKANLLFLIISLTNLSSFPLTVGFIIKHLLLNSFYLAILSNIFYSLVLFCSVVGILYTYRLVFNLFFSFFKFDFNRYKSQFISYKQVYRYNRRGNLDRSLVWFLFLGLLVSIILLINIIQTVNLTTTVNYLCLNTCSSLYLSANYSLALITFSSLLLLWFLTQNNFNPGKFSHNSITSFWPTLVIVLSVVL